jgi:hypothetical protein
VGLSRGSRDVYDYPIFELSYFVAISLSDDWASAPQTQTTDYFEKAYNLHPSPKTITIEMLHSKVRHGQVFVYYLRKGNIH